MCGIKCPCPGIKCPRVGILPKTMQTLSFVSQHGCELDESESELLVMLAYCGPGVFLLQICTEMPPVISATEGISSFIHLLWINYIFVITGHYISF